MSKDLKITVDVDTMLYNTVNMFRNRGYTDDEIADILKDIRLELENK